MADVTATTGASRSSVADTPLRAVLGYGHGMDGTKLWIVGALALVMIVAALIWVLRQRGDGTAPVAHDYGAPEVTITGQAGVGGVTFGGDTADDVVVDQTVPLSRLGGAGWRDGGGLAPEQPNDAYAVESRSWGEDESVVSPDPVLEHHVEVDDTGARPVIDDEVDRDRGGHW